MSGCSLLRRLAKGLTMQQQRWGSCPVPAVALGLGERDAMNGLADGQRVQKIFPQNASITDIVFLTLPAVGLLMACLVICLFR